MKRHALVIVLLTGLIGMVLRSDALIAESGPAPLGTLKEICDVSPLIIEADVQSVFPVFAAGTNGPVSGPLVTDYLLNVNRVIKGPNPGRQIVIGELGGILGERKEVVDHKMPLAVGQRYILFLKPYAPKTWVSRGEIARFASASRDPSILIVGNSVRLASNSKLRSLYEGVSVTQMLSEIQARLAH